MKRKASIIYMKSVLLIATIIFTAFLTHFSVKGQNDDMTMQNTKILLKKVEKDTDTILSGAKLAIFSGEGTTGHKIQEIMTDGSKVEVSLGNGVYTLSELEAPANYKKAEDIIFKIENNKLYFKQGLQFVESENFETIALDNYEAFADRNDETFSWGYNAYGKHYYLRENEGRGQVIYCFNVDLHEPAESFDDGATIEYNPFDGTVRYTKIVNPLNLKGFSHHPRENDPTIFYNKIKKVIYAGFPNNKKDLQGDLTDTQFKTATQLAIYYYTDSIDVDTVEHGFEGIREEKGKTVREVFDKLIQYVESDEIAPEDFKINMFKSNNAKYQNMIGTSYNPDDLLYTVQMEDEKDTTPKPAYQDGILKTTVKAGEVSSVLDTTDASHSKEAEIEATVAQQGVRVSDTIQYSQLMTNAPYKVTARLMKVVEGQEAQEIAKKETDLTSSDSGQGEWVVTFDEAQILEANTKYVVFEKLESLTQFDFNDNGKIISRTQIAIHEDLSDKAQTIVVKPKEADSPLGTLQTTVKVFNDTEELATGNTNQEAILDADYADNAVNIKDTIIYTNLVKGAKYKVTTRLMKVTGNNVVAVTDEDGKIVEKTTELSTNVTGSGMWEVDLDEVILEENTTYVLYEKAESVEEHDFVENGQRIRKKQVIVHEDSNDKAQTIVVTEADTPTGALQTIVKVFQADALLTEGSLVEKATLEGYQVDDKVQVKDRLVYLSFVKNAKYKVTTRLMKITGNTVEPAKDDNGQVIEKETNFTASETGSGIWEVDLGEVRLEPNATYVMYEKAESVEEHDFVENGKHIQKKQLVKHENQYDVAQTIAVKTRATDTPQGTLQTTVKVFQNNKELVSRNANQPAILEGYQVTENVQVKDTMTYTGLVSNAKYRVTTRLMKVTGNTVEPVLDNNGVIERTTELSADASGSGTWEVDLGEVDLEPNATYVVYEKAESINEHDFVEKGRHVQKKQVLMHEDSTDKAQTIIVKQKDTDTPLGTLQTTVKVLQANTELATGSVTKEATLEGYQVDEKVRVKDTIIYTNLIKGASYKVTTRLMKVMGTNATPVIDGNGKFIEQEIEFVADASGSGTWEADLGEVDLEPNATYVVYEKAESINEHDFVEKGRHVQKKQYLVHENKDDKAQTIIVKQKDTDTPLGTLQTTVKVLQANTELATGSVTKEATLEGYQVDEKVRVKDTITYTNLIKGASYKVTTRLMKVTGTAVTSVSDENGQEIQKETVLTTDSSGAGTWEVDLGEVSLESNATYVVYEKAESVNEHEFVENARPVRKKQVLMHEDSTDKAQTITVKQKDTDIPLGTLQTTVKVLQANTELATGSATKEATLEGYQVDEKVHVKDTITYTNLIKDASYKVTTRLMKVTGTAVTSVSDEHGQEIQKETVLTTDSSGSGTWEVDLGEVNLEPNVTYIIYERAETIEEYIFLENGYLVKKKQVLMHEDSTDKAQTITVKQKDTDTPQGTLQTTVKVFQANTELATGSSTQEATLESYHVDNKVTIKDTITYTNLVKGASYKVTTRLMKVTGTSATPVMAENGEFVEQETEFVADDSGTGTWEADLGQVSLEPNATYVIYEKAESVEEHEFVENARLVCKKQVLMHEDSADKAQTIIVKQKNTDTPQGTLQTTVKVFQANTELATGRTTKEATLEGYQVDDKVHVKDVITYTDLVKGASYKVTTRLMKVTGTSATPVMAENGEFVEQETEFVADDSGTGTWEADLGQVSLEPNATYIIYEGAETVEEYIFVENGRFVKKKQYLVHEDKDDKAQTIIVKEKEADTPLGTLQTTVKVLQADAILATGNTHQAAQLAGYLVDEKVQVKDIITYTGLVSHAKYRVMTRLMKVTDTAVTPVIDENGQTIEQITELSTDATGSGTWEVDLGYVNLEPNATYVLYEQAESVEDHRFIEQGRPNYKKQLIVHEDNTDKAQTIIVTEKGTDSPLGTLQTTVKVFQAGIALTIGNPAQAAILDSHLVVEKVQVKDTISYTGLISHAKYKVTTRLMKVTDTAVTPVISENGQAIEKETELVANENGLGIWEVDLGHVSLEPNATYVIYEKAESLETHDFIEQGRPVQKIQVIVHEDSTDKAQTIMIMKRVEKEVTFSKVEVNGTEELDGAHLKVVKGENENGQIVKEWVSGKQPVKLTLTEGIYTMIETQAPLGYQIAEKITFKITAEGTLEIKQSSGSYQKLSHSLIRMEDALEVKPQDPKPFNPTFKTIKVSKIWQDTLGAIISSPVDKVVVELYKDGQATGMRLELNALNHWSDEFKHVQVSGKDDENYTVKEIGESANIIRINHQSYQVSYSGNLVDGFSIINQVNMTSPSSTDTSSTDRVEHDMLPQTGDKAHFELLGILLGTIGIGMFLFGTRRKDAI